MKCLVTRLNGIVDNDSLLKLGEVKFKFNKVVNPTSNTQNFYIAVNKPTTLKINGGGFFTDKNLTENKGNTLTIDANNSGLYFVSNNDVEISVIDKYNITDLRNYDNITASGKEDFSNKFKDFDLSNLIYCAELKKIIFANTSVSGDIASLGKLVNLNNLSVANTSVSGDIASLGKLVNLTNLSVTDTSVSGDIAPLGKLVNLTNLSVANTSVSGDIASLGKLVNLTNLSVTNTSVSGDIASLGKLTKLGSSLIISDNLITGDLGTLPDNIKWVRCSKNQNFTWTTTIRTKILAMENVKCDQIDNLLNDLAGKEADFGGAQAWFKSIVLIGSRTSASDAAVQTLQNKGYTVRITP
jgi:hypothetical protein